MPSGRPAARGCGEAVSKTSGGRRHRELRWVLGAPRAEDCARPTAYLDHLRDSAMFSVHGQVRITEPRALHLIAPAPMPATMCFWASR